MSPYLVDAENRLRRISHLLSPEHLYFHKVRKKESEGEKGDEEKHGKEMSKDENHGKRQLKRKTVSQEGLGGEPWEKQEDEEEEVKYC